MSLRVFIFALCATFSIAWLSVVVVPYFQMRELQPIMMKGSNEKMVPFIPKRAGRVADGAAVYAANGCYLCHTQVIRPVYAGVDVYRSNWAGLSDDEDRGDTRRETNVFDYQGESFAQVGITRYGSDLSNLARRVPRYSGEMSAEDWLYLHLFNPREIPQRWDSKCPSHEYLFKSQPRKGQSYTGGLPIQADLGMQWVPTDEARALVSYLLSLTKDQQVPAALDFSPPVENSDG